MPITRYRNRGAMGPHTRNPNFYPYRRRGSAYSGRRNLQPMRTQRVPIPRPITLATVNRIKIKGELALQIPASATFTGFRVLFIPSTLENWGGLTGTWMNYRLAKVQIKMYAIQPQPTVNQENQFRYYVAEDNTQSGVVPGSLPILYRYQNVREGNIGNAQRDTWYTIHHPTSYTNVGTQEVANGPMTFLSTQYGNTIHYGAVMAIVAMQASNAAREIRAELIYHFDFKGIF